MKLRITFESSIRCYVIQEPRWWEFWCAPSDRAAECIGFGRDWFWVSGSRGYVGTRIETEIELTWDRMPQSERARLAATTSTLTLDLFAN